MAVVLEFIITFFVGALPTRQPWRSLVLLTYVGCATAGVVIIVLAALGQL